LPKYPRYFGNPFLFGDVAKKMNRNKEVAVMKGTSTWGYSLALTVLVAILGLGQMAGCGGGSSSSPGSTKGTLKMSLSDKQSVSFQKLLISIKEVRVVPAGLEELPDNDPALPLVATYATPLQVDVLTLKFLLQSLGQVNIPAGSYTQVRIILADNQAGAEPANYLVLASDASATKIPVKSPSAQTSGLKVNCQFQVTPDNPVELVVDFDPNAAIVATGGGKYLFKPTGIRVVEVKNLPPAFGYIYGTLSSFVLWYNAEVKVVPATGGTPVATANVFASYSSGNYQSPFSSYVPSGTYRIHVNSPGFLPYSTPQVTVASGEELSLGPISFIPIVLRR
jgi:uncharacterized protein DUF4382